MVHRHAEANATVGIVDEGVVTIVRHGDSQAPAPVDIRYGGVVEVIIRGERLMGPQQRPVVVVQAESAQEFIEAVAVDIGEVAEVSTARHIVLLPDDVEILVH